MRPAGKISRTRGALVPVAVAGACVLATLGISGCGAASVIDPVARAADVSSKSPGYRMVFSMRISSPALPVPISGTGTGAFDVPDHSGSFALAMDFGAIPQVQRLLGTSTLRLQEVIKGSTLYLKFPAALTRRAPAHKPWLKIDLAKAGSALGVPGLSTLINNPASGDPSQMLQYLRETAGSVTKVGIESVDGIQTTHYRATISLDRVPNGYPASDRPQVRQTVAALERLANVHMLPVQVWVDGQHLVRRMQMAFAETVSGQTLSMLMSFDIPQYGPESAPQLPAAGQVTDLAGLGAPAGG